MLGWDAVSALSTALSTVVVMVTVALGFRQLRIGAQQVEHLRRATQLQGTMKIFDDLLSPEMTSAVRFIIDELPRRIHDPNFCDEVIRPGQVDPTRHPEMTVLRMYEKVGVYVKNGLLDPENMLDFFALQMVSTWRAMEQTGLIAMYREARSPLLWENYEMLARAGEAFIERRSPETFRNLPAREPATYPERRTSSASNDATA